MRKRSKKSKNPFQHTAIAPNATATKKVDDLLNTPWYMVERMDILLLCKIRKFREKKVCCRIFGKTSDETSKQCWAQLGRDQNLGGVSKFWPRRKIIGTNFWGKTFKQNSDETSSAGRPAGQGPKSWPRFTRVVFD